MRLPASLSRAGVLLPALLGAAFAGCLGRAPGGLSGGAQAPDALDSWPADGTWGVPPALPLAIVHLPEQAPPSHAAIEGPGGEPVPATTDVRPCAALAFPPGRCIAIVPATPLQPSAAYHIVAVEAGQRRTSRFATSPAGGAVPAQWLTPSCAIDEAPIGPACVLAFEDRVFVRVSASAPVRIWLTLDGAMTETGDVAVASRGEAVIELDGLASNRAFDATLRAVDMLGRTSTTPLTLTTTPPLARLFITEVRANPIGPEPAQEYVEVVNSGAVPMDLQGCALSDSPRSAGDVIGMPVMVPAGARVLLVPDAFDPLEPDDPPVPPGVQLVRMGSSLGSGGLSNSGEPVLLRDAAGRRLSAVPAVAAPSPGVCLVRIGDDGRTDDPAAFAFDAAGSCTPGLPDRIP